MKNPKEPKKMQEALAVINDDQESYSYQCPDCGQYNDIEDRFVWNGPHARNETTDTCSECPSKKKILVYR